MADRFENKGAMAATIVVATSDSLNKAAANYVCDGVNDHVEIQAALDALPATGGEVVLLDGTYNCEVTINLDSYQTLRGCGRNTILTTSTADLVFLSAVGTDGFEKVHIVISDMQIDGGAGTVSDCGIYFEYVDYSLIHNVYSRRHASGTGTEKTGIFLVNSDFNQIVGNVLQDNSLWAGIFAGASSNNIISLNTCEGNDDGIYLDTASNGNTVTGNNCQGNITYGIYISNCEDNVVVGNVCQGNGSNGIYIAGSTITHYGNNVIVSNTCQGGVCGIYLYKTDNNTVIGNICQEHEQCGLTLNKSDNNTVVGNAFTENSQDTTNTYDDIFLEESDYNNIQANTCRAGGKTNKPRYGINISDAASDKNLVIDNDLYDDGFGTAPFNDAGTGTKLNVFIAPFVDGNDPQDSGFLIDADTEYARSYLRLPDKVVQVVRMKVYARAGALSGTTMALEFVIEGGADNEPYTTHTGSVANHPSTSSGFAANDVIFWTVTEAGVLALLGGDSVEVKVLHEAADAGGVETNAYIRTVEIEYV